MTNYEHYKDKIDMLWEDNYKITIDKDTNEVDCCNNTDCADCLFSSRYNAGFLCEINRMKWLVAEYVEPEIDWSKVPVDTPVLVSDNNRDWYHRHLAKVVENRPYTWGDGRTSWTTNGNDVLYKYTKLAEASNEKSE